MKVNRYRNSKVPEVHEVYRYRSIPSHSSDFDTPVYVNEPERREVSKSFWGGETSY